MVDAPIPFDSAVQGLLTTIAEHVAQCVLPALMIGGHAVTTRGHPYATFELGPLMPIGESPALEELMVGVK